MKRQQLKPAVITVGRGCGFVVKGRSRDRYIVTSSDCLPWYEEDEGPKLEGFRLVADRLLRAAYDPLRIFRNQPTPNPSDLPPFAWRSTLRPIYRILGTIGEKPTLSACCVFVDPISGVAVLGSPGDFQYDDEDSRDRYVALTNSVSPLRIADIAASAKIVEKDRYSTRYEAPAWVPSRTGELLPCTVSYVDHLLGYRAIVDTMSIWTHAKNGPAYDPFWRGTPIIGAPIVTTDGSAVGVLNGCNENPRLTQNLPGWLLHELTRA